MDQVKLSVAEKRVVALTRLIIQHPWRAILVCLLVLAVTASGARFLEFSNNYREYFGPDNPELRTFAEFQNTYTKNDNIMFVVKPATGSVFTPEVAGVIERLTAAAWQIPYAIRVDSISNFQHSWADGDELTVEDLIRAGTSLSAAQLALKKHIALSEPLLNGNLIARDGNTTGINVTLQYPELRLDEVPEAVAVAREIAAQVEAENPGMKVALTGISMLNNAFAEAGQLDFMTLMPVMYVVLITFLVLVLRSVTGTLVTLLLIGFASLTAIGVEGYAGIKLTAISATAPVVIMTLAIADSVHILVTLFQLMREGMDKASALVETMRINFAAVSITSLTTIVGFLSLNFSDAPPFIDLGNITAVGIAAAWFYSLVMLPALMTLLPVRVKPRVNNGIGLTVLLGKLADFVTGHHRQVLLVVGAIAVVLVAFIPRLELNDEFVKYFDQRVEFRRDADFAAEHLNGPGVIEYSVPAMRSGGISDIEYLEGLERFVIWLRAQPEVRHVYTYTDVVKRLNRNMHGDDPAWYRLPENRELAAQYLLLYELSLPYGLDLNDRIDIDKAATRVSITLDELSTVIIRDFLGRADEWMASNLPGYMLAEPTGASVMFSYISKRNIESMLRGNVVAVVMIALVMMLALRSFAMGTLSLLPNALPILMTYGVWSMLVGQVGMPAAAVSATSLGIVVDDTVHFLLKYLRARREKGMDVPAAIHYAFETVGFALVSTTVVLVAGVLVLAGSTFQVNSQTGMLTALAISLALPVDLLLLPALLMLGHKK